MARKHMSDIAGKLFPASFVGSYPRPFDWSFAQTGYPDDELALFATPGFEVDLGLGAISNKNYLLESPQEVAEGIRKACRHVAPERVHLTTDCGLFAYARSAARAKLKALVKGGAIVRQEMGAAKAAV